MKKEILNSPRDLLREIDEDIVKFGEEEFQRHNPQYYSEHLAFNYWIELFSDNLNTIPECFDLIGIFCMSYNKGESPRDCLILCKKYLVEKFPDLAK